MKKLKKRRNLITQIESTDEFYRKIHNKSTSSSNSSLKRTSDNCLDNTSIKKQHGNEGERLPSTCKELPNQSSCSPHCSSPVHVDSIPPELTVSPIKKRDEGQQRGEVPKSTNVFVKVAK